MIIHDNGESVPFSMVFLMRPLCKGMDITQRVIYTKLKSDFVDSP